MLRALQHAVGDGAQEEQQQGQAGRPEGPRRGDVEEAGQERAEQGHERRRRQPPAPRPAPTAAEHAAHPRHGVAADGGLGGVVGDDVADDVGHLHHDLQQGGHGDEDEELRRGQLAADDDVDQVVEAAGDDHRRGHEAALDGRPLPGRPQAQRQPAHRAQSQASLWATK
ncbi:MAG: hypothetical protein IPH95_13435 [Candidatus Promineofilum sp.]|nr:hypothetical protein [Promineifilum sp.]